MTSSISNQTSWQQSII